MKLLSNPDVLSGIQNGAMAGGLGGSVGMAGYSELTMSPEEREKRDAVRKAWRDTSMLNKMKDLTPVAGTLFPSDEHKAMNSVENQILQDKGVNPTAVMIGSTLAGSGIAGGLAAKKAGMFSYMTARYSDSKKPKDWTKKTKYNKSFKDKGISL